MRIFKTRRPKLRPGYLPLEAVAKMKLIWHKTCRQLADYMNRQIAKGSRRTKILVLSTFCFVMGVSSMDLLYRTIQGEHDPPTQSSPRPSISQPVTPLLSDSTLEAIRKFRSAHRAPASSSTDSFIKK